MSGRTFVVAFSKRIFDSYFTEISLPVVTTGMSNPELLFHWLTDSQRIDLDAETLLLVIDRYVFLGWQRLIKEINSPSDLDKDYCNHAINWSPIAFYKISKEVLESLNFREFRIP